MADTKISQLTPALSVTGPEVIPVVQGGANKSVTASQVASLVTLASLGAATAAQGGLADSAVQPGDLGTAAAENVGAFATAAQGATADAAQAAHADQRIFGFLPAGPLPVLSWDEATWTLTLSGAPWSYYRNSVKYTSPVNRSVTLPGAPPASGKWYVRIAGNDGTLTANQTPWTLDPTDNDVTVCTVEINNALTPKSLLYTELHLCDMNRGMHRYEHLASGPKLVSGAVVSGYTLAGNTTATNTFGVSEAYYMAETLGVTVPALVDDDGATLKYLVRSRLAGAFTWAQSLVPYLYAPGGYIQWDNAGTLTAATAINRYINTYLLATQAGWQLIVGQANHTSLAAAQAETFQSLSLTGLQLADYIAVAQLTWRTGSYGGLGLCRLEAFARITVSSITVTNSTGLPAPHASTHDAAGSDPLDGYIEIDGQLTGAAAYATDLAGQAVRSLPLKQDLAANLTAIAALTPTDSHLIVGNGTTFVAETGATARASLGLGDSATKNVGTAAGTVAAGDSLVTETDNRVLYDEELARAVTYATDIAGQAATTLSGSIPGAVPASATAPGVAGQLRYASGFLYVCVAANTWQRVALATWS